jgi:hypothetical protein
VFDHDLRDLRVAQDVPMLLPVTTSATWCARENTTGAERVAEAQLNAAVVIVAR